MATVGQRVVVLAACLCLGACSGERAGSVPDRGGGTVVVAFNAETQSFNPLVNTDQNTNEVNYYLLFTPLIQYDRDLQPRPYLARDWKLDSLSVTFQLNRDVHWHDGPLVTAYDVAFTFDRAKDPETASVLASAFLDRVRSVEVLDSFTVRFEFSEPHARPLDGFWWPPLPRHLLQDVPPDQLVRADFNRRPVGSGPFRFVSWKSGASLTFERDPDFPASLGGPAKIDRVIIRFIGDASTLLAETLTGDVDVDGSLFPDQADEVEKSPNLRLMAWPSREYYYIGWNIRDPLFSDARVRRALTLAIDRQQLIDVLLHGHGRLATGTIAPWHPMYRAIPPLPFDPAAAAAALDSAGWRDRDGDGTREDAGGRPFRFTLMTNHENPIRSDIAQVVQAEWAKIGVQADVRMLEWQTLLARHRAREFDGVVQSWVLDNFRVDPFSLFHSSQADRPGSYNRSGLKDPRVDRLMERAMSAGNADSARRIWTEFALALQQAQPFTFLMWLDELAAVSNRLHNVQMDARGTLASVAEWTVDSVSGDR